MWTYYKRVLRTAWKDFKAATLEQMIGVLIAIAILFLQIKFGVIHQGDVWASIWSIAWPYIWLVLGLLLWNLIRVPWKIHVEQAGATQGLEAKVAELQTKIARPVSGLTLEVYETLLKTDTGQLEVFMDAVIGNDRSLSGLPRSMRRD
jgi:hypothetical protein